MSETKIACGGIGFWSILFIVFLVLKLCNVITWSWWWVCAPIWIPIIFWVLIVIILYKVFK
jgi:hypothetical protein